MLVTFAYRSCDWSIKSTPSPDWVGSFWSVSKQSNNKWIKEKETVSVMIKDEESCKESLEQLFFSCYPMNMCADQWWAFKGLRPAHSQAHVCCVSASIHWSFSASRTRSWWRLFESFWSLRCELNELWAWESLELLVTITAALLDPSMPFCSDNHFYCCC